MNLTRRAFLLGLLALIPAVRAEEKAGALTVYAGTYTGQKSQGIYLFRLDPGTGKATRPELAAKVENPSFLALPAGASSTRWARWGSSRGRRAGR